VHDAEKKNIKVIESGDSAGYCFIKGITMTVLQNYEKAIRCYDSTLYYNKTFVYALLNRGAALFEEENLKWEELKYTSAIGINKTGFGTGAKIKPPSYKKSLADYNRLITLYPSLPYVYYNRANLKTNLRKFQRAIDDYSMAIKLNPGLAEAYFNRALVLLYLKENKLACKDLSKAGELGIEEAYNIIKRYCGK
jgi:tetratricopeptide (TPR) repeat protein